MKVTLIKLIPEPVLIFLRRAKGVYNVDLTKSFNTYTQQERIISVLPKKFDWFKETPLCHIMKVLGTDKACFQGNSKHNYTTFYFAAFKQFMHKKIRLFEMGIGTTDITIAHNMGEDGKPGASLKGWKKFFSNAEIFGADIDRRILFDEERITTFYVDQLDKLSIKNMWHNNEKLHDTFDIIIDDGLHTFKANTCFFESSYDKLHKGSLYIIEDVDAKFISLWEQIIMTSYVQKFPDLKFTILRIPNDYNQWDNSLIIIEKVA